MKRFFYTVLTLWLTGSYYSAEARLTARSQLPVVDSVSIDGITWRFSEKVPVGQFVNGDYYVVGAVTVSTVEPPPDAERNGSVLNLPVDPGISGFDGRVVSNRFRDDLRATFPLSMTPGDALVSSIGLETIGTYEPWLREGNNETPESPVKSYSVLTCLEEPVSDDAFRPSYCDREQKIYYAGTLRRDLLPALDKVAGIPELSDWASHFRRPWLDVCYFHFDAATQYQAMYGREVARSVGIGTLMLMCDFSEEDKEPLLINIIQYGIDLWGIARAGYPGWPAHGGHGSGRKWPIIFAGMLLGDTTMAAPNATLPSLMFGEDMQTMYDSCWTGAKVVYAGHQGVIDGKAVSTTPGWGPYEHKHPSQWADSNKIGEDYRRCCTSLSWVGEALAARIIHAIDLWDHDPFFDYVDRWMTENDSAAVATIKAQTGWDYSAAWARQGQCWDAFVENMWNAYRDKIPENIDYSPEINEFKKRPGNNFITWRNSRKDTGLYSITGRIISKAALSHSGIVIVSNKNRQIRKQVILPR